MKVFISWSGERSRAVATALRDWLPDVIQGVEPWMSSADIEAGARWGRRVQDELGVSNFGIICVTPENQTAPWLLFEAGALAKSVDESLVVPYLIALTPAELRPGPLTQFQAKVATRSDTYAIVRALNGAMKDAGLPAEKLDRAFDRWWPDLDSAISRVPQPGALPVRRTAEDMLEELLVAVRELRRESTENEWESPYTALFHQGHRDSTVNVPFRERIRRMASYNITSLDPNAALANAIADEVIERLRQVASKPTDNGPREGEA